MTNNTKVLNEGLNDRLKEFRLAKNLTQKEIANSLGIATSYYSDIENTRRSVSKKVIEKLNNLYNVSINWMYTGQGGMIETKDVPNDVPFDVPKEQLFDMKKEYTLNNMSATLIDALLNSSLQILNFYCSSLLGQISGDSPHNNQVKIIRNYATKTMRFSSDIRQKLLDKHMGYDSLDLNEKIVLLTQINTLITEALDLLHRAFSRMTFKWKE